MHEASGRDAGTALPQLWQLVQHKASDTYMYARCHMFAPGCAHWRAQVTPEWVHSSLSAGRWLPERGFAAAVRCVWPAHLDAACCLVWKELLPSPFFYWIHMGSCSPPSSSARCASAPATAAAPICYDPAWPAPAPPEQRSACTLWTPYRPLTCPALWSAAAAAAARASLAASTLRIPGNFMAPLHKSPYELPNRLPAPMPRALRFSATAAAVRAGLAAGAPRTPPLAGRLVCVYAQHAPPIPAAAAGTAHDAAPTTAAPVALQGAPAAAPGAAAAVPAAAPGALAAAAPVAAAAGGRGSKGHGSRSSSSSSSLTRAAAAAGAAKAAEHRQGLQRLVVALGGRVSAGRCLYPRSSRFEFTFPPSTEPKHTLPPRAGGPAAGLQPAGAERGWGAGATRLPARGCRCP